MPTQEKDILNSILIAALLIGIIIIFFIIMFIRQQRRFRKLAQAKIVAEVTTLENERKRLASDLHDEVGPLLSAIKLRINHIEDTNSEQQALIDKSSSHIDEVIKKIREISNDLLPNILIRRGIAPAVQDFINKIGGSAQVKINFNSTIAERLPQSMEINIYRIILEIIHNCIKHSKAAELKIALQKKDKTILLQTMDNGVGFNLNEILAVKGGHGLLNLESRTDVLNGNFSYESEINKGTRYFFEFPVEN